MPKDFEELMGSPRPVLALAPMQEVTDLPFWKLMSRYDGADVYFTEYFRVTPTSRLDKDILRSITDNPTGRPVIAQMIGNDIRGLIRTASELQHYPVSGIDLNLGCPAPIVYKKCAGGGLLREPARVDGILGALRDAIEIPFSVKTRIGFEDASLFEELLSIFARHSIDLLTVHGRTVKEMYRSEVHYDMIARAVEVMSCPVLANGNVYSAENAESILRRTGARGLMIGRGAIRNPWIFRQIRLFLEGASPFLPKGCDVLEYVENLYESVCTADVSEKLQVQKMKRYMNYLGIGVEPSGEFLHRIRRVITQSDFFAVCHAYLGHDDPMPLEPFDLALHDRDLLAGQHR